MAAAAAAASLQAHSQQQHLQAQLQPRPAPLIALVQPKGPLEVTKPQLLSPFLLLLLLLLLLLMVSQHPLTSFSSATFQHWMMRPPPQLQ
jgi:hypothetical protein